MDKAQDLEQRIKDFFANKTNENVNKVYVTSDGNLFKAEHYAIDWSKTLPDKNVKPYNRHVVEAFNAVKTPIALDVDTASVTTTEGNGEHRQQLVKRYIELFDTKPDEALTDEALANLIAEKEAETGTDGDKKEPVVPIVNAEPTKEQKAAVKAEYIALIGKQPTAKTYEQQLAAIAAAKAGK